MYGKRDDLIPKLPPMSRGTITRRSASCIRSAFASTGKSVIGPMKFAHIVSRPEAGSWSATIPYVSIGVELYRSQRSVSVTTRSARRRRRPGRRSGASGRRPRSSRPPRAAPASPDRAFLDSDHGVERLVVGDHELRRVLGEVPGLGRDRGDRLPRVARAVDRQRVVAELVGDPRRERVGQAGSSAPESAQATPGEASAAERSTERISACAQGERANATCSGLATGTSSTKRPRPVSSGRSSRRGSGCPTQVISARDGEDAE